MQALRQRIADLNATFSSPECKVCDDVWFYDGATLKLLQLAMAESDIAAAQDGTQQASLGLRRGGARGGIGTHGELDGIEVDDANCRRRR